MGSVDFCQPTMGFKLAFVAGLCVAAFGTAAGQFGRQDGFQSGFGVGTAIGPSSVGSNRVRVCATLFQRTNYGPPSLVVSPTRRRRAPNGWNNKARSIKVTLGCTFTGYQNYRGGNTLGVFTSDDSYAFSGGSQGLSSWKCTCSSSPVQASGLSASSLFVQA